MSSNETKEKRLTANFPEVEASATQAAAKAGYCSIASVIRRYTAEGLRRDGFLVDDNGAAS
jgi:hypothetical protein